MYDVFASPKSASIIIPKEKSSIFPDSATVGRAKLCSRHPHISWLATRLSLRDRRANLRAHSKPESICADNQQTHHHEWVRIPSSKDIHTTYLVLMLIAGGALSSWLSSSPYYVSLAMFLPPKAITKRTSRTQGATSLDSPVVTHLVIVFNCCTSSIRFNCSVWRYSIILTLVSCYLLYADDFGA